MKLFIAGLVLTAQVALAQVPAGVPLQIPFGVAGRVALCFVPSSLTDGASVVLATCPTAVPEGWIVDAGGSSTGIGPATQVHIGDKCLDVKDGNNSNGAALQVWTCGSGNPNQLFNFNSDSTITWAGKNKCIDLPNGRHEPGQAIQIWQCYTGNTNQKWFYRQIFNDPGTVPPAPAGIPTLLRTGISGPRYTSCITALSNANGGRVTLEPCIADTPSPPSQQWIVVKGGAPYSSHPSPGEIGQIKIYGNKCLDLTDGNSAYGTQLQIWDCAPEGTNQNQLWSVWGDKSIVWGGNYQVLVEIPDQVFGPGTPIVTGAKDYTSNEIWNAYPPYV